MVAGGMDIVAKGRLEADSSHCREEHQPSLELRADSIAPLTSASGGWVVNQDEVPNS